MQSGVKGNGEATEVGVAGLPTAPPTVEAVDGAVAAVAEVNGPGFIHIIWWSLVSLTL